MSVVGLHAMFFSHGHVYFLLICQILFCWLKRKFKENLIKISGKREGEKVALAGLAGLKADVNTGYLVKSQIILYQKLS